MNAQSACLKCTHAARFRFVYQTGTSGRIECHHPLGPRSLVPTCPWFRQRLIPLLAGIDRATSESIFQGEEK